MNRRPPPPGARSMAVDAQAGSPIVPAWPVLLTACAAENVIDPKFASGVEMQLVMDLQSEGALAMHSAEVVSTAGACTTFVNDVPCVRFHSRSVTAVPATATLARMWSPAAMVS